MNVSNRKRKLDERSDFNLNENNLNNENNHFDDVISNIRRPKKIPIESDRAEDIISGNSIGDSQIFNGTILVLLYYKNGTILVLLYYKNLL